MAQQTTINRRFCTSKLRCDIPHVGLYDVAGRELWISKKRIGVSAMKTSHARMLSGGTNTTSVADKDRFVCFWFHTPGSGDGLVHGYPIEWDEGHLMVRLDPCWNYATQELIRSTDTAKVEYNIEQQYRWGQFIFETYAKLSPKFPLSWHMLGPRPTDSMFYVQRIEGTSR